jgi:hypothetical protein
MIQDDENDDVDDEFQNEGVDNEFQEDVVGDEFQEMLVNFKTKLNDFFLFYLGLKLIELN